MQFCFYKAFCLDIITCQWSDDKCFHCNLRSIWLVWMFLWLVKDFSLLRDFVIYMQFCFYKTFCFDISTSQGSKNKLFHCKQRSIWRGWMFVCCCGKDLSLLRDFIVWIQFCFYKSFCFDISPCQRSGNKFFHCNQRSIWLGWMFLWLVKDFFSSARFHNLDAVLFLQVLFFWLVYAKEMKTSYFIAMKEVFGSFECFSGLSRIFLFCEISLPWCSFVSTSRFVLILVRAKEAKTTYFIARKEVFGLDECFSGLDNNSEKVSVFCCSSLEGSVWVDARTDLRQVRTGQA